MFERLIWNSLGASAAPVASVADANVVRNYGVRSTSGRVSPEYTEDMLCSRQWGFLGEHCGK